MIGMFDSGSGGLSVLTALRKSLPQADIVYFGDIKNAPYGGKSLAELTELTHDALVLLKDRGVHNIVSACNSVSASLATALSDTLASEQTIIEMVGPTVASFKGQQRRIAICATEATIKSGMYESGLKMAGQQDIVNIPIPELAGQVEFGASEDEMKQSIKAALEPVIGTFDVCVLACTHYPLARNIFAEVLGTVEIFDPAEAVAERAQQYFSGEQGSGQVTFLLSQDSEQFHRYVAERFGDMEYTIEIV